MSVPRKRSTLFKTLLLLLFITCLALAGSVPSRADISRHFVVVLDPGHGGEESGAAHSYNGVTYIESVLNYKIAIYTMQALTRDAPNIDVFLTRKENEYLEVDQRVPVAMRYHPDLIVSLHNNSFSDPTLHGACVLLSSGTYREELMKKEQVFARYVLQELTALGIARYNSLTGGLAYRLSEDGTLYPNGRLADYYAVVKHSVLNNVPGVIIEHAFMSNEQDMMTYLRTEEQLRALGEADARAIIRYFKDQEPKPVEKDGWQYENGKYYYYQNGAKVVRTLLNLDGEIYYVNKDGVRMTGWVRNIKGKAYFFDDEGRAVKGWYTDSQGNRYYFNSVQGFLYANRIIKNNGKLYACKPDGRIAVKEFVTIDGKTYYAPSTGVLYLKWHKILGKWYYFNSTTGIMYQNTSMKTADNKQVFYFGANGVCLNRKD